MGTKKNKEFEKLFQAEATEIDLDRDHAIPPKVRFVGVPIASKASEWGKQKTVRIDSELDGNTKLEVLVKFRTKFDLYRDREVFYLHKLGESTYDGYRTFFTVIPFRTASELRDIIADSDDRRLHASRPLIDLIEMAFASEWLTEDERDDWRNSLLVSKGL